MKTKITTLIIFLICAQQVYADSTDLPQENSKDPLKGLNLSIGFGVSKPSESHVKSTTLTSNNIVYITDEAEIIPSLWLTTNWTFEKIGKRKFDYIRPGIFVGLGVDSNASELLNNAGLGAQVSFLRNDKKSGINLGLGYSTQKISLLGNGVKEGQPLPEGENTVRMKSKYSHGPLLLISFNVF